MGCKGVCTTLLDTETFWGPVPNASSVTRTQGLGVPNLHPLPPQGILPALSVLTDTPTDTRAAVLLPGVLGHCCKGGKLTGAHTICWSPCGCQ